MSPVLQGLDAEWRRLARSPRARRALMRWRVTHPVLAGVRDFDDLLERRRGDPAAAHELLLALARLAPGDEMAARVLLQAVVPALVRLSLTIGHGDRDALDEMLALAWERIRTYPPTRFGSVAANVQWDVRKQYRRHREADRPTQGYKASGGSESIGGEPVAARLLATPSAESEALDRIAFDELVGMLAEGRRQGVIDEPALGLIVRTRIVGEPITELADRSGTNHNTLISRRFRAERRLREFQLAG